MFDATNKKICDINSKNNTTINLCGIDILIDNNIKPWFIELNRKPGMSSHHINEISKIKKEIWINSLDIAINKNKNVINNFEEICKYY